MYAVKVLVVNISAGKLEEGCSSSHTLSGWKEFIVARASCGLFIDIK